VLTLFSPSSSPSLPLSGVQVKTRKRNIVVPSDPGSFADAVVHIIQDAGEGKGDEADLEAGAKALDTAELEYARYGDTLFEVFFTGGRLATGATLAEDKSQLKQNVSVGALLLLAQHLEKRVGCRWSTSTET